MDENTSKLVESELLSTKKLAHILDCSTKTVQDWLYKDRKAPGPDPLPYYRLGGLVRFRLGEVLRWIQRRRVRVSPFALCGASHPRRNVGHQANDQNL
jgi:predicted DNA-binding transcriptional regulator AlpA